MGQSISQIDFINRKLIEWDREHPYTKRLRELNRQSDATYSTFQKGIEHENPEICANAMIGLIKVTCFLLDKLLERLEKDFLQEGGLRERMTRARLSVRNKY
jgi:four helix bundle suffix protein